jgi:hypothetical protein
MGSPGRSLLTDSNVNATTGAGVGTDESTLKMVDDTGVSVCDKRRSRLQYVLAYALRDNIGASAAAVSVMPAWLK